MTEYSLGLLVICRHTESEWSTIGKIAGKVDVPLTEEGRAHAKRIGLALQDITFDVVYTSEQQRAKQTRQAIIAQHPYTQPPLCFIHSSLNERDFGELTGHVVGTPAVDAKLYSAIQNEWDTSAPGGESVHQVSERVIPFYEAEILPRIRSGKKVLIVTHGTPARVLIKYLHAIPDDDIGKVRIGFGELYSFVVNADGSMADFSVEHA